MEMVEISVGLYCSPVWGWDRQSENYVIHDNYCHVMSSIPPRADPPALPRHHFPAHVDPYGFTQEVCRTSYTCHRDGITVTERGRHVTFVRYSATTSCRQGDNRNASRQCLPLGSIYASSLTCWIPTMFEEQASDILMSFTGCDM